MSGKSWRAQGNDRRDIRQTKGEVRPQGGSRKNTRKWCRGVVNRKHKPVCQDYDVRSGYAMKAGWKVLACEACGKHLEYYFPSPWRKEKTPPPDWVTQTPAGP